MAVEGFMGRTTSQPHSQGGAQEVTYPQHSVGSLLECSHRHILQCCDVMYLIILVIILSLNLLQF